VGILKALLEAHDGKDGIFRPSGEKANNVGLFLVVSTAAEIGARCVLALSSSGPPLPSKIKGWRFLSNPFSIAERIAPAAGTTASFFFLLQKRILSLLSPDYAGCRGRNMSTYFRL
jgi:hypothetical protein